MTYQTHQPNITSTRTAVHFRFLFIIPFTSSGTSHVPCINSNTIPHDIHLHRIYVLCLHPSLFAYTTDDSLYHGYYRPRMIRVSNTPTKTQLHLFSYALFVTPLIFNLGIRWRRVVKFMPRPFYPWKKCRY
jgi:hypothetical protein